MKTTKIFFLVLLMAFGIGCKKNEIKIEELTTVSVINAIIDGKVARLNDNLRDSCSSMSYKHFTIVSGIESQIKIYPSGSQNTPYFSQMINTGGGDIYSIFLTGTNLAPESVQIKEAIPPYPSDEVINVRLINLAPGSGLVSLTLGNEPNVNIFSSVAYKQNSGFKSITFPTALPTNRNQFQIRDNLGNLLFTYTMPTSGVVSQNSSRKRNITIAYKGISGGTGNNAIGVIVVPHY